MSKGKIMVIIISAVFGAVLLYALICCGITFIPMMKMSKSNDEACGKGSDPVEVIVFETDAKLYAFPSGGPKDKYVVICPGGGYTGCAVETEGFPIATALNKLGYSAFVLEYRTGDAIATPKAPLDDLANAIRYVDENAEKYNVYKGYYVLCGFSAGGNLIGLFGTGTFGYCNYDGIKAPNALIMGYPWCNPMEVSFNGNIADYFYYSALNKNGANAFLKTENSYDDMRVPLWIDEEYPRTFIMHGDKDTVAPAKDHSDVLVQALEKNNIDYLYKKCEGVYHGCGLGIGTSAEGWLTEAMAFSCQKWYEDDYETEPLTCEELKKKAGGFICGVCHPENEYEQLEELGGDWARIDIPALPFDRNGNMTEGYKKFKEDAKNYVDRGFKVFAVTPIPRQMIDFSGLDPRNKDDIPLIMEQLRYMMTDLQGLVAAFQVMNEQTEMIFREPLTLEEDAEFMGMSLRVMNRYKGDAIVGYNLSANDFATYLNLLKNYQKYTDFIGIDVYLGCFESITHNLGFAPAMGWMWLVWQTTNRPVIMTEFGYLSAGECKSDEEKLEILHRYGAIGETINDAEEYAKTHITEFLENDCFPPGLRNYMRVSFSSDAEIAEAFFGDGIGANYSAHLYLELGRNVNVDGYPHTPLGQAAFYTDFFDAVVYDCDYLCGVIMYRFKDAPFCGYCWQEECPQETSWGLLDADAQKKPSFYAIKDAFEKIQ